MRDILLAEREASRLVDGRHKTQQHDGNLNATRALLPDPKTSSGKTAVALTSDDGGGGGGGASCADFSVDLACVFISSWILNRIIRLVSRTKSRVSLSRRQ